MSGGPRTRARWQIWRRGPAGRTLAAWNTTFCSGDADECQVALELRAEGERRPGTIFVLDVEQALGLGLGLIELGQSCGRENGEYAA